MGMCECVNWCIILYLTLDESATKNKLNSISKIFFYDWIRKIVATIYYDYDRNNRKHPERSQEVSTSVYGKGFFSFKTIHLWFWYSDYLSIAGLFEFDKVMWFMESSFQVWRRCMYIADDLFIYFSIKGFI